MIRVCPHSDTACPHGMGCTFSCATDAYDDGEKRPAASPADGLVTIPPNLTAAAPRAPTGRVWSGAIGSGPAERSAMPRADQEYIAELQSKLTALVEADCWRSIDTAPRDGARVLVAHASNGAMFTVNWDKGAKGWVDGSTDNYDELVTYSPSHWRPLPSPPAEAAGPAVGTSDRLEEQEISSSRSLPSAENPKAEPSAS